uniref:Uncharacterized protein n=1 Tax=Pipistrellus kuhlii TaxID=59472 RepID=A0A7J7QVD8_PIPKU|nr:hypothetical protein mPipKuh1_008347 [Pipistrellus kuhlii]
MAGWILGHRDVDYGWRGSHRLMAPQFRGLGNVASPGLAGPGRGRRHRPQWVLEGNDVTGHGELGERPRQRRGAWEDGTVAAEKHGRWRCRWPRGSAGGGDPPWPRVCDDVMGRGGHAAVLHPGRCRYARSEGMMSRA